MEIILHISDLHLSTNIKHGLNYEKCKEMALQIGNDAKSVLAETGKSVDSIIFTGDLVFSGKEDEYSKLDEYFIRPLLESFNIDKKDLYICPGNHDSDRNLISRFERKYRETSSIEEKNKLATDIIKGAENWNRIQSFNNYKKFIDKDKKNIISSTPLYSTYKAGDNLYILSLSSAWLAQDDDDKENLYITESQLKEAIKSTPTQAQRILLVHHPLDWINLEDANPVSALIEKKIDALLFGHMHHFDQSIETKFSEDITLRLQAGTLDTQEKNTGYSIIQLHNKNNIKYGKATYRKYSSDSKNFGPWIDRGKHGEFDFSIDGNITFDSEKFALLSAKILEKADKEILINTGINEQKQKSVRELFVQPNFGQPECLKLFPEISHIKNIEQLKNFQGVAIICGGSKQGKSFTLQYIYTKKLEKQSKRDFCEICFHLDAKSRDLSSKNKIIQSLIQEYIDQDLSTSFEKKIKQSVLDGHASIFIDNFCDSNINNQKAILEFIEDNPSCRYLISISSANEIEAINSFAEIKEISIGAASIGGLKRNNIREIVSKWAPSIAFDTEDKIYSDVMRVAKNSQLPHNHFIYSMLLAIYENKRELKGIINESDVIENFIEILLRKHFIQASPQQPQYKELLHFLGYTSQEMIIKNTDALEANSLLKIALEFNEKTLFTYQVEFYIEPLTSSGILIKTGNTYQFSQVCFFDFAASYYMSHSDEFKSYILSNENYLKLDKVVEYYASKNPSTTEVLEFIKKKTHEALSVAHETIISEHRIDIYNLDLNEINNISFLDIASTSEEFEEKIHEIKSDKSKNDELMDEISPLESNNNSSQPKKSQNSGKDITNVLKENLSLYSRVFRSTELTMNPEETLGFFDDITTCYILLTKSILSRLDEDLIIPLILPKIEEEFFASGVTREEKEEFILHFRTFLSIVKGVIPNHVQQLMSDSLSSRKPRLHNIINKTLDRTNDEIKASLLTYLLIDIEHGDLRTHIKRLIQNKGSFSKKATFFKLMQLLFNRHDLPEETRKFISKSALQLISNNKENLGERLQHFTRTIESAIQQ
ncbi:metallophosphoesterase [Pseudomonas sp. SG20056]|uniref:metallophosphoesterase n=1 Tax=Pseudomonas sp. SG20056 TaxID=3074146 RepID=UPI00287F972C|nr:metallophosphoesterase [Pseudomonas sp. SG20056]WNF47976.1 metallophosphoesterase [Pseudomonas sp. SG20056]